MKVRWREHEMILITIIGAIVLTDYLWDMYNISAQTIEMSYAVPFIENHVPFNLYQNVLWPDLGLGLLIYLSYLWINLYMIPRLFFSNQTSIGTFSITISLKGILLKGMARGLLKKLLLNLLLLALLVLIIGTGVNLATYYWHEWQFHYPGFSIWFNKDNQNSQLNIAGGLAGVGFLTLIYFLYVCFRQAITGLLERQGERRSYRIMIINQVTGFLVLFSVIPSFLAIFEVVHNFSFFLFYFSFIPPVILVFLSNMYWLFPLKGESKFFTYRIISRLFASTFLYTLLFVILLASHPFFGSFFLSFWAVQLFIVTPISWLVYQQRKDKILQLRGVEKALVKSKADLQFLRSQINPHFLFNALNTLYGTALREGSEQTAVGIQKLGDMMRFMLHENNLDFIPMNREIEYLENYISLQKLRTQSSPTIAIEENINQQHCNHLIVPMLLIPFIENAFKHGISLTEKSWIKIVLSCDEKHIRFEVRNSIHPRSGNDPEKEKSGIGLKNVYERLKLIYPGKHEFSARRDGNEFVVQLSIQP